MTSSSQVTVYCNCFKHTDNCHSRVQSKPAKEQEHEHLPIPSSAWISTRCVQPTSQEGLIQRFCSINSQQSYFQLILTCLRSKCTYSTHFLIMPINFLISVDQNSALHQLAKYRIASKLENNQVIQKTVACRHPHFQIKQSLCFSTHPQLDSILE